MYYLSIGNDCGPFTVTFMQKASVDASYGALDSAVFSVDQTAEAFTKEATTDSAQVEVYNIVYTVKLDNYPLIVSAQSSPFVITVVDPCLTPSLSVPSQTDPAEYKYTGSSPQASFVVADFTVTPS